MSVHVIKGTGAPTTTPTKSGVHYIDTLAKKQYFSVGTSSVADWVEVGSGSGGSSSGDSGINYITLGKADTGLTGWNTYADAAGVMPVDGKLGTALITFTQSLTTPLRGSADFNLSKPGGVNSQGNGVAYDFSIHRADLAKVLTVSFDYEIVSGTYSSGDVTVYLVQDINGTPTVIQPANHKIQNVVGTSKHIATFQTASNVTDYRLCFHVASVSTSDYVLALDNISVGPQTVQYGAPVTDWQDFPSVAAGTLITATTTNPTFGTVQNNKARWRRVGSDMEIRWDFRQSTAGTAGSGIYLFNLPPGFSIDSTKTELFSTTNFGDSKSLGTVQYFDPTSTTLGTGYLYARTATQLAASFQYNAASTSYGVGSWSSTFASFSSSSTIEMSFVAKVPIAGWSSVVQMSDSTDTRVVAAKAHASVAQAISSSTTLAFGTIVGDTHGGFTSSTTYTIPVSGWYRATANLTFGNVVTSAINLNINKNGTTFAFGSSPNSALTFGFAQANGKTFCNSGDTITVTATQNSAAANYLPGLALTYLDIERVSGPSAIAASETVCAVYKTAVNQSVANTTFTIIDFGTKEDDSHGSVTTGANWKFTAPTAGRYEVSAKILFNGAASAATGSYLLMLYKNGSQVAELARVNGTGGSNFFGPNGSRIINLNAGDYIDVRAFQDSGGARTLYPFIEYNHISIIKK